LDRQVEIPLSDAGPLNKIQLVKTILKILTALVSIAVLWIGYEYVLFVRAEADPCGGRLTLNGDINSDTFLEARDCLVRSTAAKKTFVVKMSGGGNAFAALAVGILIRRHNWDVEVIDICASSCANWIFPAGKTKYLNSQSMLLFHGGPDQENLLEMIEELEQGLAADGAPVDPVELGHKDKEGVVSLTAQRSAADEAVLEFLSINKDAAAVEKLSQLKKASDRFYQESGINPLLPTYGQTGGYEPSYKSYEYGGFIYRLDSLRRLGISNIELKNGEWHPERHPAYPEVYEVTFP
jgi:hypothetical protein